MNHYRNSSQANVDHLRGGLTTSRSPFFIRPISPPEAANGSAGSVPNWRGAPLRKQLLMAGVFLTCFIFLDGSSTAAQDWEGAPASYLPVGLAVALLLPAGLRYWLLVCLSSLIAAFVNYHRPIFSWCGLPGALAIYLASFGGLALLRGRWRINPELGSLRDIGRYAAILFIGASFSAFFGILTLIADHLLIPSKAFKMSLDWWASDSIALVSFAPFLLVWVAPRVQRWLFPGSNVHEHAVRDQKTSMCDMIEITAQALSILAAVWLVFGFPSAFSYQPLYILFIPLIWAASATVCPELCSALSESTSV